jgi:hypothetical protein
VGLKSFAGMPLVAIPAAVYMISQHLIGAYLTRVLDRTGSKLLGPAIASEPRSLERYLERAIEVKAGSEKGLALVVFRCSVASNQQLSAAMGLFVRRARRKLRLSDFVCLLPPDGFGVVLVDTRQQGCDLVIKRMEAIARQSALLLNCGAAVVGERATTPIEVIAVASGDAQPLAAQLRKAV